MAWQPLFDNIGTQQPTTRFTNLPLVLAGPILRKSNANEVSVWVALKSQTSLTLQLYIGSAASPFISSTSTTTSPLGDNLHVAVVTITGLSLTEGVMYTYDMEFGNSSTTFVSAGILTVGGSIDDIVFQSSNLPRPSFSLPPTDMNQLRIIHASCRKPHGENRDALEGLHDMIDDTFNSLSNSATWPFARPHQLYLTGDQIYADDVADSLLLMIMDASKALLNWNESLLVFDPDDDTIMPGMRSMHIKDEANFTAEPQYTKSHLIKLGEFYSMYLFVWSPILWDALPPTLTEVRDAGGIVSNETVFGIERYLMIDFKNSLPKIRKALANIPVYMILDDHEITDDWNLSSKWIEDVYSSSWGKRIISNGLTAYAIFQHWGNKPSDFNSGQPGADLLALLGTITADFANIEKIVLPVPDNLIGPTL